MIKAIVAVDKKNGIAKEGNIPWKNKEDLEFFKIKTIGLGGNCIVMGRKTKESLPVFPLKGRVNIVLTSNPQEKHEVSSINEIIELHEYCDDVFIIGGKSVYEEFIKLRLVDELYISKIPGDFSCDQFLDFDLISKYYRIEKTTQHETFSSEVWILK